MKKILKLLLKCLSLGLVAIAIVFLTSIAIRGVAGNVTPTFIVDHLRTTGMPFELSPERGHFALTYSIAENHSFEFTRDIAAMAVPDLGTVNGKYVSLFAPGISMMALPLYYLGKSVGLAQVFTFATSALFALLNCLLIILIVKKITGNVPAGIVASMTFLFGTVAWAYAGTFYQHHETTFFLLLTFYFLLYRRNVLTTILIGLFFSLSVLIEYPNGVFFIPFILYLIFKYIDLTQISERIHATFHFSLLVIFLGLIAGLVPFVMYNQAAYGNPWQLAGTLKSVRTLDEATSSATLNPVISYDKKSVLGFFKLDRVAQGIEVLLTSQDRGLLVFSPVILLGFLGFIELKKKYASASYALLASIIVLFGLYILWGDPWGGWAFGPRYMIPLTALLTIPLGVAIATYGRRFLFEGIFVILLVYSVTVNAVGALTSIQIPPSVEQDALLIPKLTYLHNFDLLYQGVSGSYIFNTYFRQIVPLYIFAGLIILVTSWLTIILFMFAQRKAAKLL